MALRFSLLAVDDDDLAQARSLLGETPVEQNGSYLSGLADEAMIERMVAAGLLVNVEPEEALEPLSEPAVSLDILSDGGGATLEFAKDVVAYRTARLTAPLTETRSQALTDMGVQLGRKLGRSTFVAQLEGSEWPEAAPAWLEFGAYGLKATLGGEFTAEPPVASRPRLDGADDDFDLRDAALAPAVSASAAPAGLGPYDVACHDPAELGKLEAWLRTQPYVQDVQAGESRLRLWAEGIDEATLTTEIGRIAQVERIEPYVAPEPLLTFAAQAVLGVDHALGDLPWRGAGQVIGIADSGVDAEHPDLEGRVEVVLRVPPQSPRDPRGHGTHVASIAAGNGKASGGKLAGLASEARIFIQSLADENLQFQVGIGLKPLLREAYDKNVRVQNYSWGSAVAGRHTLDAEDIDAFVHENPDLLVVVACGNSGVQGLADDASGRIELRSLASPSGAKNCLAVGASCSPRTDGPYANLTWSRYDGQRPPQRPPMSELPLTGNPDVVAALSSRGPSDDGRIKPDLVAPGVGVAGARSASSTPRHPHPEFDGHYQFSSGTSIAAPLVAGAAAVLRQYFIEARHHRPSAALLKATLINGASWIGGEVWEDDRIGRPNFHQGFGRLILSRALPLGDAAFRLDFVDIDRRAPEALRQGDGPLAHWSRVLTVKPGYPLSVTLAWTDPPGRGVQHDLDFVLVSPSGKRHVGNADLRRLPFEAFDLRNNVEQIAVAKPEGGDWAAHVFARNTYRGPQGFAVAMTAA